MEAPGVQELIGLNQVWGSAGECTVLGYELSLPTPDAAQVNVSIAMETDQPTSVTGWHFTSIFGFSASAAVAGRPARIEPKQSLNAPGIACYQSAGNSQCVIDGALTKRLGPVFVVKGGITAAPLAAEGVSGERV